MMLRKRPKPNATIRLGMVFLVLASAWRYFAIHYGGNFNHLMSGALYGLSIACLLGGMIRQKTCSRP